ncbi:uncharacterized protein LOC123014524 [Tribolium madens]|uniref:uncharacterized protein LOC123014524 n=1 Tax=Tribolium madens TaxID=41895 RepID=UPI001CF74C35|nr:uncharacterized protein LOC123014524 [Tribolium madens]
MSKTVLVLLVAVIAQCFSQPVFLHDTVKCYERDCPGTTVACKKTINTSDDKKILSTIIACLDAQDMTLKDFREDVENPFGPSTTFYSSSFSGTYVSHSKGPVNVNINNEVDPINNVETLD